MAAAGKAAGRRPGQSVLGGLVAGPVQDGPGHLEATAAGESDPLVLAALASAQVRGGRATIAQALAGMQVRGHHRKLIRVHLDHVTFLDRQVTAVEDEIAAAPDAIPAAATSTS